MLPDNLKQLDDDINTGMTVLVGCTCFMAGMVLAGFIGWIILIRSCAP